MASIEDYEQGERIGSGGFADVYRAVHIPTRHSVALKVSRQDDESLARIRREIEVQRNLAHANVMRILDWDREGFTWFVTEMAEGNLGEVHERQQLGEPEVVRLVEELLAGLGAAHRRNLVHRDLSPGNILRTQGRWVLADWGYVNDPKATGVQRLTRTGTGGGTFTWAAPETLQDAHRADGRADLYALGKLVAWLLTGKTPGIGAAPELPEAPHWRTYLARFTEEDAADRFQSAEEALGGLAPIIAALPSGPPAEVVITEDRSADLVASSVAALKRYLVGPEHRIRLFELVTKTTEETIRRIADERFSTQRPDQGDALVDRLQAYFECCEPLMHLLFTGCFFGEAAHEDLWKTSVQRIADSPKAQGGLVKMIELQWVPTLLAMSAAAFGSILGDRYSNLAAVTVRTVTRDGAEDGLPLVHRVTPEAVIDRDLLRMSKRFERRQTPASELIFDFLRGMGRSVLVSDSEYEGAFDRFQILLGLLTIEAGGWATGCFAWRGGMMAAASGYGPLARARKEFEGQGKEWGPLRVGLFAGDPEHVRTAFTGLTEIAKGVAGSF